MAYFAEGSPPATTIEEHFAEFIRRGVVLDGISVERVDWEGSFENRDRYATPDTAKAGCVVVLVNKIDTLQGQVQESSTQGDHLGCRYNLERPKLVGRRTPGDDDGPGNVDSVKELVGDLSMAGEVSDSGYGPLPILVEVVDQNLHRGKDVFVFLGGVLRRGQLIAVLFECWQEPQKELGFHLLWPRQKPPMKGIRRNHYLQWFVVPRDAFYLLHHVFDGFEEVGTLDVELVLWRLGLVIVLLRNGPDHDETVSGPLLVIGHKRARLGDDLGSGVFVLPTSPSCVVVIDAL